MKRKTSKKAETSSWKDLQCGIWERWNYRYCYLVIRQLDNGKFKPMIGAMGDLSMPGADLPSEGYHQLNTLEEAKEFLHKYVNYVRDVWDKQVIASKL